MRNLTLEGRMIVSRMLPISKIVFLALLTKVPYRAVEELENSFFGKKNSIPKIKHETCCKELATLEKLSF